MPRYDYRCRTCGTIYEERRSITDADAPAVCPSGHVGAARLLPVFATTGLGDGPGPEASFGGGGHGCCGGGGGGCACRPG